ncbi:hypothetical protein WA577_001071 [Blastocystis sp. JDR]
MRQCRTWKIDGVIDILRNKDCDFDPEPTTIPYEFRKNCAEWGEWPAVVSKDDMTYSYSDYYRESMKFAKALLKVGMRPHDVCAMIGFNSPEYYFSLQGTWMSGGVTAGIYTTNSAEACAYVLKHSEAKVCVCQSGKSAMKIASICDSLPQLKAIVVYWPDEDMPVMEKSEGCAKLYRWEEFLEIGKDIPDSEVDARIDAIQPGSCATLIYTSGTTGDPKGVMCSHDACMTNALNIRYYLQLNNEDRFVSFLPMNHIAAQYVDTMIPVRNRITMYLARPDALRGSLVATLRKARPTFFVAVPRVYEKFMESIRAANAQAPYLKQYLISWFEWIGLRACKTRQYGQVFTPPYFYSLAKSLAFDVMKEKLGLDKTRLCIVSAAPVTEETITFFASYDFPIYDLLGQSEGTAPICTNTITEQQWKIGTVGRPLRGVEVKTDPDNGEFLYRGRNVMMGYLKSEADTVAAIDADGWLHSGDQGEIDADGFVKITGRLKELIVTAGGENVSPVPIENKIVELCPLIANCVVVGDKRKFLSCLVSLKTEVNPLTGEPSQQLAKSVVELLKAKGSKATTVEEAKEDKVVKKMIGDAVEGYNAVAISRAQQIRKWKLMERDL